MINKNKKILAEEEWKWEEYYEDTQDVIRSYYLFPTTEDKFYLVINKRNIYRLNETTGIVKLCTAKIGLLPGNTLVSTLCSLVVVALVVSVRRKVKLKK